MATHLYLSATHPKKIILTPEDLFESRVKYLYKAGKESTPFIKAGSPLTKILSILGPLGWIMIRATPIRNFPKNEVQYILDFEKLEKK